MKNENGSYEELVAEVSELRNRVAELETANLLLQQSGREHQKDVVRLRQHEAEIEALLKGSRTVLENQEFKVAARKIFDYCCSLLGATAGYVALLSSDGTENEVLFLEAGGLPCTVDPSLPMPIRGLREVSYRTNKAVYDNDFIKSEWMKFMPEGHAALDNVMFSPLIIDSKTVGIMGLANKKGGFNENDAKMAEVFGEYAAIALRNSRTLELLESSEEMFRSVAETAVDAIVSVNSKGNIILWNQGAGKMFGYSLEEAVGKPITIIIPDRYLESHRKSFLKALSTNTYRPTGDIVELEGRRKDGSEFPLELSLALWKVKGEQYVTSIMRDSTLRKEKDKLVFEQSQQISMGELLINIAHHWRQPLNSIGLIIQNIEDDYKFHELNEENLNLSVSTAMDELDRLSETIDSFSRLYNSEGYAKSFHVWSSVKKCLDIMEIYLKGNEILVNTEFTDREITINGREAKFSQALINILTNSADNFKATGQKEREIIIKSDRIGDFGKATITIADNGGGIDEKIIDRIFDPYFTTKGKTRGAGLGLYLAKTIIEREMGGKLTVKNVNRGVEFSIEVIST